MQVVKYEEIVQQSFVQTNYMLDVVLPSLVNTISEARATQSVLINVYKDSYFGVIELELNAQKKVFELHLENLVSIHDEFTGEIEMTESLDFDEEIKEFEHKLLVSINKLTTLINKMDIEIQKLKGYVDGKVSK